MQINPLSFEARRKRHGIKNFRGCLVNTVIETPYERTDMVHAVLKSCPTIEDKGLDQVVIRGSDTGFIGGNVVKAGRDARRKLEQYCGAYVCVDCSFSGMTAVEVNLKRRSDEVTALEAAEARVARLQADATVRELENIHLPPEAIS